MKTVFDNRMVAHIWAQRSQETARSHNGNFHFTGDTIYSYREPVGRLIDTPTGTVALVTSNKFSRTTSCKHRPAINTALDHGRFIPIFYVPLIPSRHYGGGYFGGKEYSAKEVNEANLKSLEKEYLERKQRLIRSRGCMSPSYLRQAYVAIVQFAAAFELEYTDRDVVADVAKITHRRDRLAAKHNDPAYLAKREQERAKREAKALAGTQSAINAWRNGVSDRLPYWRLSYYQRKDLPVLLRVRGDNVETSLGATVPVSHAKRAWPAIKRCRETQSTWERNGHAIHVGHFQFDAIDAQGNVRAGCHFIRFDELTRLAIALGLEGLPESASAA